MADYAFSNESTEKLPINLKDYKESDFLIDKVNLEIDIEANGAAVISNTMQIKRAPNAQKNADLLLDGEGLELLSVAIDGKTLKAEEYKLTDTKLSLPLANKMQAVIEIKNKIYPDKNTSLKGLYRAGEVLLTQCEPHGFRKITYYLDRPDVMSEFTTKIIADKKYPILLSNGDMIAAGELDNNKHFATWHDYSKKPSYLFAAVIGDLAKKEDTFTTKSGKTVKLQMFTSADDVSKVDYAITSLKDAMAWDEKVFGREYDLNTYMIVATPKFNSGAMENKGLNIFLSKYVLANKDIATDNNFKYVHSVIGHEYFHNWTGNRITIRDWFQLSLKEGLTVFRDQEFTADYFSPVLKRINDVDSLKAGQFEEDAGPLSHPVLPESYVDMNNFYTTTVYEKGAEIVRMLQTILGKENFIKAMDLYFARHDGQAVTANDFIKVMEEQSKLDLTQFKLWYSQPGTPIVEVKEKYLPELKQYELHVRQRNSNNPLHTKNKPFMIPIKVGLVGNDKAQPLTFSFAGKKVNEVVLMLTETEQVFVFKEVNEKPIPSLLRDFSAPIKLDYQYSDAELLKLLASDSNQFNRWDAAQKYLLQQLLASLNNKVQLNDEFFSAFKTLLIDKELDKQFIAELITLPSASVVADALEVVDPLMILQAKNTIQQNIGQALQKELLHTYQAIRQELLKRPYILSKEDIAARSLANTCLKYLFWGNPNLALQLAKVQLEEADNLTDRLAALYILLQDEDDRNYEQVSTRFLQQWQHEGLVVEKLMALQAMSQRKDTLMRVQKLIESNNFDITVPSNVYAVLGSFANNPKHFHAIDGSGYNLLQSMILKLDAINPAIAANIAKNFDGWHKLEPVRRKMILTILQDIQKQKNISATLREVVDKFINNTAKLA